MCKTKCWIKVWSLPNIAWWDAWWRVSSMKRSYPFHLNVEGLIVTSYNSDHTKGYSIWTLYGFVLPWLGNKKCLRQCFLYLWCLNLTIVVYLNKILLFCYNTHLIVNYPVCFMQFYIQLWVSGTSLHSNIKNSESKK